MIEETGYDNFRVKQLDTGIQSSPHASMLLLYYYL